MKCSYNIENTGDYSTSSLIRSQHYTARKRHFCTKCGCRIAPGTIYLYSFWISDGNWYVDKICPDCEQLINVFFDGYCPVDNLDKLVAEYLYETKGRIPENCLSKLTQRNHDWVFKLIEQSWRDHYES